MYHFIVNPASKSGHGIKLWRQLEHTLSSEKVPYQVHFSRKRGDLEKIAAKLSASSTQVENEPVRVIVLGGDGTLNEFLQGVRSFRNIEIGLIPTGSSNDFARDMEYPADPIDVLHKLLACRKAVPMDLGLLTWTNSLEKGNAGIRPQKRFFAVSLGMGFDAAVCEKANHSKLKYLLNFLHMGKLIYLISALRILFTTETVNGSFSLDDGPEIPLHKFHLVACMIHRYQGGGFMFAPNADIHDGMLDICVADRLNKLSFLTALPLAFKGTHYRKKGITPYRCTKISIKSDKPLWVHTDGEAELVSSHIEVSCVKNCVKFLL